MEAARVAALRGHSVDLYEKTDRLGGVFNEASAFDFKDDDRRLLAWYKNKSKMQELMLNLILNLK